MQRRTILKATLFLATQLVLIGFAVAATEEVAFQFEPNTGGHPGSGVIRDAAGNFYGTTSSGLGNGVVYKLSENPDGTWSQTILHKFKGRLDGGDGSAPWAAPTFDSAGNLYGTTAFGGDENCSCGIVYKLIPQQDGTWSEQILYRFTGGADGGYPYASVILDESGNIYGTAAGYGLFNHGTVYRLSTNPDGTYTGTVLHQFAGGHDGAQPMARLTFDDHGNLFGTTASGGVDNVGTVFALTPSGNVWKQTIVYHFQQTPYQNGFMPMGGVVFDNTGNLYGTTFYGGKSKRGTVFELTPTQSGPWNASVLLNFDRFGDSGGPRTDLVFDAQGNLYGTASGEIFGSQSPGSVFELTPNGHQWTETVLWNFSTEYGQFGRVYLFGAVAFDDGGNIYGTTFQGGDPKSGFVYKITP